MSSVVSAWVKRRRSGLRLRDGARIGTALRRVGDGAGVSELGGRRRAFGVDGVGQPSQAGDRRVAQHDLMAVGAAVGRHRAVGHRAQPDAACRETPVEPDQLVGDDLIGRPPLEGRRLDDAVAQPDRAQRRRGEGIRRGLPAGGVGMADVLARIVGTCQRHRWRINARTLCRAHTKAGQRRRAGQKARSSHGFAIGHTPATRLSSTAVRSGAFLD